MAVSKGHCYGTHQGMPPLLCPVGSEEVSDGQYLPSCVPKLSGLQKPTHDEAAGIGITAKLSARGITITSQAVQQ